MQLIDKTMEELSTTAELLSKCEISAQKNQQSKNRSILFQKSKQAFLACKICLESVESVMYEMKTLLYFCMQPQHEKTWHLHSQKHLNVKVRPELNIENYLSLRFFPTTTQKYVLFSLVCSSLCLLLFFASSLLFVGSCRRITTQQRHKQHYRS